MFHHVPSLFHGSIYKNNIINRNYSLSNFMHDLVIILLYMLTKYIYIYINMNTRAEHGIRRMHRWLSLTSSFIMRKKKLDYAEIIYV